MPSSAWFLLSSRRPSPAMPSGAKRRDEAASRIRADSLQGPRTCFASALIRLSSEARRDGLYDAPVRYPVEDFTAEERGLLAPHFTNLDQPVFALVNLPETVKGALFARYSRYSGTVRRLYLEEFADDTEAAARPFDGVEGERAAGLYERVFVGYGDGSIAQVGGAHVACEWGSNIVPKLLKRG